MKYCKSSSIILKIPVFQSLVKAGFPSPADDYIDKTLDFNEYLVRRPAATFCVKVSGDSMINAGIFESDILIVDRSLRAIHNQIVIAIVDGEMTVKRLCKEGKDVLLLPDNPAYKPIKITNFQEFEIWGVVTFVIHRAV